MAEPRRLSRIEEREILRSRSPPRIRIVRLASERGSVTGTSPRTPRGAHQASELCLALLFELGPRLELLGDTARNYPGTAHGPGFHWHQPTARYQRREPLIHILQRDPAQIADIAGQVRRNQARLSARDDPACQPLQPIAVSYCVRGPIKLEGVRQEELYHQPPHVLDRLARNRV